MNRTQIAVTGLGAAIGLATSVALAAPVDCSTPAGRRNSEAAYRTHARYLEDLFESDYGCRALESFSRNVSAITRSMETGDPCEVEGMRRAASDTVRKVVNRCLGGGGSDNPPPTTESDAPVSSEPEAAPLAADCIRNGEVWGRTRARLYCIPDGETGAPVSACDAAVALACSYAFDEFVNEHCIEKARRDPDYERKREKACAPPRS